MSSTDIQNSIISAPQLKIDANGELVVDEARFDFILKFIHRRSIKTKHLDI